MQAYQFGAQFPVISQITGYTDLVNGQQMAATNGPRSPIVQTCDASEDMVTVCFGAISSVAGTCDQRKVASIKSPFPVDIGPDSSFDSPSTPVSGTLSLNAHQRQIIQSLLDQEELTLYTMCSIDDLDVTPKPEKRFAQVRCRLDITIYGYVEDAKE
ncbi:hypothetical protein CCHR01_07723 [Colletotrichum chrysophilum]|uniref:Uncharacterized protein n=1 Tax=Colletotrichum chrysophilum TaxID=1836956 RepID=A0AAD9AJQ8_9PEZI|nr:hypothetical protein CCHR01_07723 [Colletotrichum chrysophilum]